MSKTKEIYGRFGPTHLENMKHGIILFNQQKYWECHEILEDYWFEDMGDPARYVYWAVIQVACSMIHYRDKNIAGAEGMLGKAKGKFDQCRLKGVETPLLEKNLSWRELRELVFAIPPGAVLQNYQKLYNFRFKNPSEWEYEL